MYSRYLRLCDNDTNWQSSLFSKDKFKNVVFMSKDLKNLMLVSGESTENTKGCIVWDFNMSECWLFHVLYVGFF